MDGEDNILTVLCVIDVVNKETGISSDPSCKLRLQSLRAKSFTIVLQSNFT